ncbi:Co-chaperone [Sorochytrium milnesiophthora]
MAGETQLNKYRTGNLLHAPRAFKTGSYAHPRKQKSLKQVLAATTQSAAPDVPNYVNISAPPSLLPAKKYCDITGLEGKYTDPQSGLRYHNVDVYKHIQTLSSTVVQQYLALKNKTVVV